MRNPFNRPTLLNQLRMKVRFNSAINTHSQTGSKAVKTSYKMTDGAASQADLHAPLKWMINCSISQSIAA